MDTNVHSLMTSLWQRAALLLPSLPGHVPELPGSAFRPPLVPPIPNPLPHCAGMAANGGASGASPLSPLLITDHHYGSVARADVAALQAVLLGRRGGLESPTHLLLRPLLPTAPIAAANSRSSVLSTATIRGPTSAEGEELIRPESKYSTAISRTGLLPPAGLSSSAAPFKSPASSTMMNGCSEMPENPHTPVPSQHHTTITGVRNTYAKKLANDSVTPRRHSSFDDMLWQALGDVLSDDHSEYGELAGSGSCGSDIGADQQSHQLNPDGSISSVDQNGGKGTLLCQVCSDMASGFHYGIHSCEGCKGFFRRSIQKGINYPPCKKMQQCAIVRSTRNRCQHCRFRKCLSVGMSRDAVRFGRVPKREKIKIEKEILKASIRSQIDSLAVELEDGAGMIASLDKAFQRLRVDTQFCSAGVDHASDAGAECVENLAFYFRMVPSVAAFSKSLCGFRLLSRSYQKELLKGSIFQLLLLAWSSTPNGGAVGDFNTAMDSNAESCETTTSMLAPLRLLVSRHENLELFTSVAEFVQRFRLLDLNTRQLAVFAAMVLCQSDQEHLGNLTSASDPNASPQRQQEVRLLRMIQDKLWMCLQSLLPLHDLSCTVINQAVLAALSELKTMSKLHYEHLDNASRSAIVVGSGNGFAISPRKRIVESEEYPQHMHTTAAHSFNETCSTPKAFNPSLASGLTDRVLVAHDTSYAAETRMQQAAMRGVVAKKKTKLRNGLKKARGTSPVIKGTEAGTGTNLPELRRMLEQPTATHFHSNPPSGLHPPMVTSATGQQAQAKSHPELTIYQESRENAKNVPSIKCGERMQEEAEADRDQTILERHREMALLLDAPPMLGPPAVPIPSLPHRSHPPSGQLGTPHSDFAGGDKMVMMMEVEVEKINEKEEEEEEPLNLCIREVHK